MKSPWKFLVGLTRRHDKHDAPDVVSGSSEQASSDSDVIAPPPELEAAPPSTNIELSVPASALEEEPEHIEDLSTLAAIAAAAAVGKGEEPLVATSRPAKRPRPRANNKQLEINSTAVQLATPSHLAQELDSEIHRLRLQLAQKLRVQNTQLKQMLARFED